MIDPKTHERIKWACRRGMLELDLILEPYVQNRFPIASPEEQALFIRFLHENDQDLFDWLLKKTPPAHLEWLPLIRILLQE